MKMKLPTASIIVMTHNRSTVLKKTLNAMLRLDYPNNYEIIVINDGSIDNTAEMLKNNFEHEKKIIVINQKRSLPCKARNNGIKKAKNDIIVIMDDDCIPDKTWLKDILSGFTTSKIGMVSSFFIYGGTSTAFRREVLEKVGLYDEDYGYYREDTDLVFRVWDAGYKTKPVKAKFIHDHKMEAPKTLIGMIKYAFERVKYHKNDVLLYKKHPERTKEFLDIKLGFIIHPIRDFKIATGLWPRKKKFRLSSPQGIVLIQPKSIFHKILIFLGGIFYTIVVKSVRFYGSIKFKKLLI